MSELRCYKRGLRSKDNSQSEKPLRRGTWGEKFNWERTTENSPYLSRTPPRHKNTSPFGQKSVSQLGHAANWARPKKGRRGFVIPLKRGFFTCTWSSIVFRGRSYIGVISEYEFIIIMATLTKSYAFCLLKSRSFSGALRRLLIGQNWV